MKNWTKGGLDTLLKKLEGTGSTEQKRGSGRPKMARTEDNVSAVKELVLNQEDQPVSSFHTFPMRPVWRSRP